MSILCKWVVSKKHLDSYSDEEVVLINAKAQFLIKPNDSFSVKRVNRN